MKWRVMAALMAVTFLALLVQDIPLSQYMQQSEHDRIITSLERDALVLASRSEESLRSGTTADYATVTQIAKAYHSAGGARVIVVDARGIAVFSSDTDDSVVGTTYLSRPEIVRSLTGKVTTGTRYSKTLHETLLYVAVPVLSGTDVFGAVRLTYPASVISDRVNAQLGVLAIVALIALILAGLVGYVLSASITRSLDRLRTVTTLFASGSLTERADETHGASELRSLARSFNLMAERLHGVIAQQRAFASDASHQLRNPLTALGLRLERARELAATDPLAATSRLVAAEAELDRLADIIEGLLRLSRAESADEPLATVDLVEVAREHVDRWEPLAAESDVRITLIAPASAPVSAVAFAPGQIVDNFLDNALAVAPKGSAIELMITVVGAETSVVISDRGPGMPDADLARAFDRFWRGSQTTVGSGLGLAIVAELASASGASAHLKRREGGGMVATVSFVTGHPNAPHARLQPELGDR